MADKTRNSCLDASKLELRCPPKTRPRPQNKWHCRYNELCVVILGKRKGLRVAVIVDPAAVDEAAAVAATAAVGG